MDANPTAQSPATQTPLPRRAVSLLRAVAAGRAEVSCSCEPDLFIDRVPCSDQYTAHLLARDGLIQPARPGPIGHRVPAQITPSGLGALAESGAVVAAGSRS